MTLSLDRRGRVAVNLPSLVHGSPLFTCQGSVTLFQMSADTVRPDCIVTAPINSHLVLWNMQGVIYSFKYIERILV
jgi:hypothetical protein